MSAISPVSSSSAAGFGRSPYAGGASGGGTADGSAGGRRQEGQRHPGDWQHALQQLEGDVLDAEQTLARGRAEEIAAWGRRSEDWVPPTDLGPLPDDLRERAMRLLQHQLAVAEALVDRITQSQKQRDVAARMSYTPDRPVPAYIDRAL